MADSIFRRMKIEGLDKHEEDPSHRRLRRRLEGWADSLGFIQRDTQRTWGIRPDIVRSDGSGRYLFFGDAAMADHERPDAPGVCERISACTTAYANLVMRQEIDGGRIAVATDNAQVASQWAEALARVAEAQGLKDEAGKRPSFTVKQLSPGTWVTYW